ncbi:hypothetical protein [Segetibacter koreensis]|uniref:hypothetical protein n=1 Tax=Segetibacter koreensis TaxID=398037 RepID=UPI00037007C7|nr:hypothetical protein [Segetibacter koreensis]
MKKLLLTALIAVSLTSFAFAAPVKKVNSFVTNSFNNDFKNVGSVAWDVSSSYAKATFVLDNIRTEAFYTLDGEFIGTTHAIAIEDLPVAAKRSFAKKYAGYTVKEAIKFDGEDGTAYFISAENEKESVILKASKSGLSVYNVN